MQPLRFSVLHGLFPILVVSILVPACRGPQVAIDRALTEVEWMEDGFRLHSPSRTYRYVNRAGAETGTLTILDEYRERYQYVDRGRDGTVNEIRIDARGEGAQKAYRGAEGSEALFAKADALLAKHVGDLEVEEHVTRWKEAGPGGFASLEAVGGD